LFGLIDGEIPVAAFTDYKIHFLNKIQQTHLPIVANVMPYHILHHYHCAAAAAAVDYVQYDYHLSTMNNYNYHSILLPTCHYHHHVVAVVVHNHFVAKTTIDK
jgi:hypothetical protein